MRISGSLPVIGSLVLLVISAVWAPRVRETARSPADFAAVIADPLERGRFGLREHAQGVALGAFAEILAKEPAHAEAANGIMLAATRLAAAAVGQRELSRELVAAFLLYVAHHEEVDPDRRHLEAAIEEFVDTRCKHQWYVGRAALAMFLLGREDPRGMEIVEDLMSQADLYKEWLPRVQVYLPNLSGLAPVLERHLTMQDRGARIFAGVTLMLYRRIWGIGDELWEKYGDEIGRSLLAEYRAMVPGPDAGNPGSLGGMTLLGLALYDSEEARAIVEKMKRVDHPDLVRVVMLAKLWAGFLPFDQIDFEDPRYSAWQPDEIDAFYRGGLLRYAQLVRADRMDEARKLREGVVADALVAQSQAIRVIARRTLAAVHPEDAPAIYRQLYESGAIQRVYGVFGVPGADPVEALLPALSAPDPGISALAAAALLPPAGRSPVQMPVME